jgi:hypothetical protein
MHTTTRIERDLWTFTTHHRWPWIVSYWWGRERAVNLLLLLLLWPAVASDVETGRGWQEGQLGCTASTFLPVCARLRGPH